MAAILSLIRIVSKTGQPSTPNQARFHTQYCVALAATGVDVIRPAHSNDVAEYLQHPEIVEMMQHVIVEEDPAFTHYEQCSVEIQPREGDAVRVVGQPSKGSPANPMTPDDVVEKFTSLAAGWLTKTQAVDYAALLFDLPSQQEVGWLFTPLVKN